MAAESPDPPRNGGAKTRGRPFAAGNPGKAKGTRSRVTLAVEALLEGEAEGLTRAAIDLALSGDVTALRLCLDRIAPAPKERTVALALPPIGGPDDVPAALSALITAVATGALVPGEAATLAGIVDRYRAAYELTEIESRLSILEQKVAR